MCTVGVFSNRFNTVIRGRNVEVNSGTLRILTCLFVMISGPSTLSLLVFFFLNFTKKDRDTYRNIR